MIGETDFTSGPSTLHPKAIYIVEGRLFQVEKLDFVGRKAYVRDVDCDYYTTAISHTRVTILDRFETDERTVANHGEVHVVSRVVGFKKIRFYTNENVGSGELDLPEQQMHTTSYWLDVPVDLLAALPYATDDRRDGIFGLAFAMKQIATLLLMCDGHDLGLSINAGQATTQRGCRAGLQPGRAEHRHAPHLHLRRVSGWHRLQPSAVRHARRSAPANAGAHCRLWLRQWMPELRRSGRRDRTAGEDRRAAHPRSPRGRPTDGRRGHAVAGSTTSR